MVMGNAIPLPPIQSQPLGLVPEVLGGRTFWHLEVRLIHLQTPSNLHRAWHTVGVQHACVKFMDKSQCDLGKLDLSFT